LEEIILERVAYGKLGLDQYAKRKIFMQVFDHMMKRMSFRRQKRWWNAYILYYTKTDILEPVSALNGKLATLSGTNFLSYRDK
jgi:hypothetical protein